MEVQDLIIWLFCHFIGEYIDFYSSVTLLKCITSISIFVLTFISHSLPVSVIQGLFLDESKKANSTGKYQIKLCHYGGWEIVTVDDFFPCYPDGGPVYARGHDNELWVLLLEKAYAKLCGSYAALKSGWAYEAMIDLTGAPYSTIRFEEDSTAKMIEDGTLWGLVRGYDEMGYIQSASTPGEDTLTVGGERRAKDDSTGLVAGHAYAMLRARETSCGVKLVEIRNPWGQGGMEWNGDWSDKSPLWTEALKVSYRLMIYMM